MKPSTAFLKARQVEKALEELAPGGTGGTDAQTIQGIPVDVTGNADGYVLTYDATSGKFIPKPKPAGGGDAFTVSTFGGYKEIFDNPLTESAVAQF